MDQLQQSSAPIAAHASLQLRPLVPLVARQRALVTDALRALLGLPDHVALQWREQGAVLSGPEARRDSPWLYLLLVGHGDQALQVEIGAAAGEQTAFFRGTRLTLGHRDLPQGAEAIWRALVRRIQAVDAGAGPGAEAGDLLDRLLQARQSYAPYHGLDDKEYHSLAGTEALLRLGFRCNQDCSFCWQGRDWPEPDLPTLLTWLGQMAALGATTVVLTGGEPTLYLDKLRAVADCARVVHGMQVYVQSNGIRLRQPQVLQALVDAGVRGVLLSYHSADAQVSDEMTRAPGTHRMTEQGIVAALQAGLEVDLNVVVERRTLPGLLARSQRIRAEFCPLRRFATQLGATFSFPTDYHDPAIYTKEVAPLDEVGPLLTAAIQELQAAAVRVSPLGNCGFPLCVLAGAPQCIDLEWLAKLAPEHLRSRQHPPVCESCQLREWCMGPRRDYVERHGSRGLVPFALVPPELAGRLPLKAV